jgi:AraC-like DNA-binding protein
VYRSFTLRAGLESGRPARVDDDDRPWRRCVLDGSPVARKIDRHHEVCEGRRRDAEPEHDRCHLRRQHRTSRSVQRASRLDLASSPARACGLSFRQLAAEEDAGTGHWHGISTRMPPRFHGATCYECTLGPLSLTLTEFRAGARLSVHSHARPYASVLIQGRYTEVTSGLPRLCDSASIIAHTASESHADYFHEPGLVLNIETDEPWSSDFVIEALARCLPSARLPNPVASALRRAVLASDLVRIESKTAKWADAATTFDWTSTRPIADLARRAGIHPTHFCRAFRQRTGLKPSAYRRRERVNRASRLLLNTDAAISQIAIECGFTDQSHFTNTFRSATGLPPATYRRVFGC